jgi:DNA repair photolyase
LEPAKERQLRDFASSQGQDASEVARRAVEEYLRRVSATNAAQVGLHLSKAEAKLLQEINQGLPESIWRRYHELVGKRREGTLTDDEYEELKSLTDDVELAHARRMEKLADLARLRQVPLDDLMAELGLQDPGYV